MRVLLVHSFYYPEVKGGAEYSVKKLAEGLVKNRVTVCVLTAGFINETSIVNDVKIERRRFRCIYHSYGQVRKNFLTMGIHRTLEFWNPFNKEIITKAIKGFKPDVIHTNNLYEITPVIWKIATDMKIPIIHTVRDYYLLCPKTTLLNKKQEICKNPRVICRIYQGINKRATKHVDFVTTPSKMMLKTLKEYDLFSNASSDVVYNATNHDPERVGYTFEPKSKINDDIIFVYLGGLYPHKGIDVLLKSFGKLSEQNVRLIIAGKGSMQNIIVEACAMDTRIQYKGFLDENGLSNLLKETSVLICPSIWEEPFGRVILDAYLFGLPVIASRIGALPEIVDEGRTGFLVNPGDSDELYIAMKRFIERPEIMDEMRKNIPAKLESFSLEAQVNHFLSIYKTVSKSSD